MTRVSSRGPRYRLPERVGAIDVDAYGIHVGSDFRFHFRRAHLSGDAGDEFAVHLQRASFQLEARVETEGRLFDIDRSQRYRQRQTGRKRCTDVFRMASRITGGGGLATIQAGRDEEVPGAYRMRHA